MHSTLTEVCYVVTKVFDDVLMACDYDTGNVSSGCAAYDGGGGVVVNDAHYSLSDTCCCCYSIIFLLLFYITIRIFIFSIALHTYDGNYFIQNFT